MTPAQVEVYFDLLGDLDPDTLFAAARRAVLESEYPTVPTVGRLRKLALEIAGGPRTLGPDAWQLLLTAVRRYGIAGVERGLRTLPADVARAARCFGWQAVADCPDADLGVTRHAFLQTFATLAESERRDGLLPPALRETVAAVADSFALPAAAPPRIARG